MEALLKNELLGETLTVLALSEKLIDLGFEDLYSIGHLEYSMLNDQTLAIRDKYLIDFEVVDLSKKLFDLLADKDDFKLNRNLKDLELARIKINDVSYL